MKGKLYKDNDIHYYLIVDGKIIADSDGHPLSSITNKLSLKNCQAIKHGYDLDELRQEYISSNLKNVHDAEHYRGFAEYDADNYIKGFQKALEILGDKKFSEEDMRIAFFHVQNSPFFNEFIQSLQQTEWDVEIEIYEEKEFIFDPAMGISQGHYLDKPKLDADGCLILKKITNEN